MIDLDTEFLLLVRLQVNLLVSRLQLFVILRVVLLELSFVLFQVNGSLSKLLPKLLNIDRMHAEIACHSQVVVCLDSCAVRSLRVQLHLDTRQGILDIGLLPLQPLHLLGRQVFELFKLVPQLRLVLLDLRRTILHATSLSDRGQHGEALAQLFVLLYGRVVRVVLGEEAARCDEVLVLTCVACL